MQTAASIVKRLDAAALRMRAPLWACVLLPWVLLLSPVGVALCGAWIWWDWRRIHARVRRHWTAWLDGSLPGLEDSSALLARAEGAIARMQRERILARLDADLRPDVIDSIVHERVRFDWRIAAASTLVALALFAWGHFSGAPVTARTVLARLAPATTELTLRVTPPRYTGAAHYETGPRDLAVPQFSVIEWCLRNPNQSGGVRVELGDGSVLAVGRRCARWRATGSMLWRSRGRRFSLTVRRDQPPQVTVDAPDALVRELPEAAQSAHIGVRVRDDHRVRHATLHLLLARGSGTDLDVSEREVSLPVPLSNARDGRTRSWSRYWSMEELGMLPGDELYFYVRAVDNAEEPQTSVSPTYTLRLPAPYLFEDEQLQDSLRLQGRIHAGIDALRADIALDALDDDTLRERAATLAAAQAALRERYERYLGDEAGSVRFEPAARALLRRAVTAMLVAEQSLRALALAPALAAAGRAQAAVAEVRHAERIYLYRSALAPAPLDDTTVTNSAGGARLPQHGAAQPMPAPVLRLFAALSGAGQLPPGWQKTAHDWLAGRDAGGRNALAAQRALQDVADGCQPCRVTLRAWLRAGAASPSPAMRTRAVIDTPFARAWPAGETP